MEARRCDNCRKFYDSPLEPGALQSRFVRDKPATFRLGKGGLPLRLSISIVPYRPLAQGRSESVDLCPACRGRCLKALGKMLISGIDPQDPMEPMEPPKPTAPSPAPERRKSGCQPTT